MDKEVRDVTAKYFRPEQLDSNFRLHYNPLIQGKHPPYSQLTKSDRFELANDVFAIIGKSNCDLLSRTRRLDVHYQGTLKDVDPKSHLLLAILEDFQDFLEEKKSNGKVMFERFSKREREKLKKTMITLRHHVLLRFNLELKNILGDVQSGEPDKEPILQLADFFAYATQKMYASKNQKIDRWKSIQHKYYRSHDHSYLS